MKSPADLGAVLLDCCAVAAQSYVLTPPVLEFTYAPVATVSLTIGGVPALITYAGSGPQQIAGLLQVNAVIPEEVGSGPQPVVLTIGNNANSQQQITVAVQ